MSQAMAYAVSLLLGLSAILLAILVPGGPIETRAFSNISPAILLLFNTFLTVLGIASLALIYFAARLKPWAITASALCGICYFLVYAFDLGSVFPVSLDPMPRKLVLIEMAGMFVSLSLMFLSLVLHFVPPATNASDARRGISKRAAVLLVAILILLGIAIVLFATTSAMGQ